jgi:hypothetical protein
MKHINYCNISIILTFLIFGSCARQNDSSILKGPYLGQKPPGVTPEIFAPGLISTELEEFGCSFTPDGTEFYFTQVDTSRQKNRMTIMGWSKPEIAPFCEDHNEGEPNFSPGGDIVFYGRLLKFEDGSRDSRVIIAKRKENGWGKPRDLMHGMFASTTSDSMIYYTDVSKGHAKGDIYRTRYSHGNYQRPEKLGGTINSPQQDAHPFVTPEGDLLIFDSNRHGGYGDNDLYIFRNNDIYWVDARFIEELKPDESK